MTRSPLSRLLCLIVILLEFCQPSFEASVPNNELMEKLEKATHTKNLLQQLDSLPDGELKDLLVQLRTLRRSRNRNQPPRDITTVPLSQLSDEELMQISDMIPMVEKHKKQAPVRLDIPHDLIRVPVSKFIEAFRIVNGNRTPKDIEVKILATKTTDDFGDEERQVNLELPEENPDEGDIDGGVVEERSSMKINPKSLFLKNGDLIRTKKASKLRETAHSLEFNSDEIDLN